MRSIDNQNTKHSSPNPKAEVGEIDTRAPFQSVKDAVTLFGEGAFSGERPTVKKAKPHSAEGVFAKETRLLVAEKDLNRLKEQLQNAENTKAEALIELEKAKRTVEDLTLKLKSLTESKESAIKVKEGLENQAKELDEANGLGPTKSHDASKQDVEVAREYYMVVITELDVAKQELRRIREDYDSSLKRKIASLKQETEAGDAIRAHKERASELLEEISSARKSIEKLKIASLESQKEQENILAEKDVQRVAYKATFEEEKMKLLTLNKEFDPGLTQDLESMLSETMSEIGSIQKKLERMKNVDLDLVKDVTSKLDDAKETLHKVAEEESFLSSLVGSLKLELEKVKKELSELKEKEAETESIASNLHVMLCKSKSELETFIGEESESRSTCEEMISTLNQLSSETEDARREAEEMKIKAEELRRDSLETKIALEEAEKKLIVAEKEAEEAKAAETNALDQIKDLSERTSAARASTSESEAQITISKEEFESLSRKVEESEKLAEMKVAAALAQAEAVRARENEARKRLELTLKEIEDMKSETEVALKKAERDEAAKRAVEGELRKWREREQKKVAEAASRILAETEHTQSASESSPEPHYSFRQKQKNPQVRFIEVRKMEKEKSASKKVALPSITGMTSFVRRKN